MFDSLLDHYVAWMARLEELTPGSLVKGILPDAVTELVSTKWHGSDVTEVVYNDSAGAISTEILFRDREPALKIVTAGRPWSFDGDGRLLRLVSEAHRIRLAHLFDPLLAVHTSLVEPLPHQITALYKSMLPRQPRRYLLADDPGAGKTIMAGLFIKELLTRNEVMAALNKPDDFILAIVTVNGDSADPRYVRTPFQREPDFAVTSVNYKLIELLLRSTKPR